MSVNTEPSGLEVKVNGVKKVAPASVVVNHGDTVSLEIVTPQERYESGNVEGIDTRYSFTKWSDGSTAKSRTITATGNVSLTAQMKSEYLVSVSSAVVSIPGSGWYEKESSLTLNAPQVEGFSFLNWTVNGEIVESQEICITLSEPSKVEAVYGQLGKYNLTVSTSPAGLEILIDGAKKKAPAMIEDWEGSSHSFGITALQERDESDKIDGIDSRYTFLKWNDGNTSTTRNLVLSSSVSYTAQMKSEYLVSVSSSVVSIPGSGWYEKGSSLTLTAPQVENYTFNGWIVNGETINDNPLVITVNKPTKIEAVYSEIPFRTLSVGSEPEGLKIIIDSLEYTSPGSIQAREGTSHTIEFKAQERDESSFVSGIDTKYTFKSWNDSNTSNPRTVLLDSDKSYTVQTETQYLVETSALPEGVASIDGAGWKVKGSLFLMYHLIQSDTTFRTGK
ncbi:hypothetical protein [Mesotoga sp.]|uniref:InlB B-repeat-containing protein n=1 Tax=Mesotoga sp. TaxID=2053577 RepID=UPI00345EEA0E